MKMLLKVTETQAFEDIFMLIAFMIKCWGGRGRFEVSGEGAFVTLRHKTM